MKDVTPTNSLRSKTDKYKPVALVLENDRGQQFVIDLSKFEKGEYAREFGKRKAERLSLTLWSGCESFDDFEPTGLEADSGLEREN